MTTRYTWGALDRNTSAEAAIHLSHQARDRLGLTSYPIDVARDVSIAELLATTSEVFNVKGFGAVGDGAADDGIAFNQARALIATNGGTVLVPPGDYLLTTAFTFGGQDNVVLWLMPGVVLTGEALPSATGNNYIQDWRAGAVGVFSADVTVADGFGLVIGHTAQLSLGNLTAEFQMLGTGAADATLAVGRWSADTGGTSIRFYKSRNTTIGSNTAITTGDNIGKITAFADDGTDDDTVSSEILFDTEGTISTGQVPGVIKFQVAAAGTLADALTIDSTRNVSTAGVLLQATITTLDDTGTPTVSAGNLFKTGGTTAITDFDDGLVGQTIKILGAHSITITDGAAIDLSGGSDYTMTATDTLTLTMYNNQVWVEEGRSVNGG